MPERLRLLGRDFVGFRNAVTRQAAAFPDAEVAAEWAEIDELYARLADGAAARGEVDVVLVVTDWLPELADAGQLLALDDHIAAAPPDGWPDAWAPSLRALSRHEGAVVGLAYHDGPVMLLYRRDLFEDPDERARFAAATGGGALAPPRTWAEFRAVARHFTRPAEGLWGTVLAGLPDGHNTVYDFLTHLWTRGGELLDRHGAPAFTSPAGLAALRFLHALWQVDRVVDPAAHGWDSVASGERFAAGEAAMTVNWAGFAALSSLPGSPTRDRVACATVPRDDGPRGRHVSLNVYWAMAIAAGSPRRDAAYRFLAHLASPAMDRITCEEGATGTRRSSWADPAVQRIAPYYAGLEAAHAHARSLPALAALPALGEVLNRMVGDVIGARATPETALAAAGRAAAALL